MPLALVISGAAAYSPRVLDVLPTALGGPRRSASIHITCAAVLALILLPLSAGCSEAESPAAAPGAETTQVATPPAKTAAKSDDRRPARPLPAFRAPDLEGGRLDLGEFVGQRFVLFLFNPETPSAEIAAKALAAVAPRRADDNFGIVGVAHGQGPDDARALLSGAGLEIPTLVDTPGRLSKTLGLRSPVALLVVDAEGNVVTGTDFVSDEGNDPVASVEIQLREWLRLPATDPTALVLGELPKAPAFTADRLEGGDRFDSASLAGKPAILVFFLHTCPHCHHALGFLKEYLPTLPEDKRPALVGVSLVAKTLAVRSRLEEDGLDFFPVLLDASAEIRTRYSALAAVPVIFLIDAEGRIVSRTDGWQDERDPALLRMRIAKTAGVPVPMLLHQTGFSGNEFCGVCHEQETAAWELTTHATAFDTLVRHGADHRNDCVGCHVVGWEEPGGYTLASSDANLEDVGCESCHGRGGPHLSPDHVAGDDYEPVCATCHTQEHSLGFDYASFVPKVSHEANLQFAGLTLEEKRALIAERRKPRDVLPTQADYVGSKACQSCHESEFETWAKHPHGNSLDSLEAKGELSNPDCLACHTTGFGKRSGIPEKAAAEIRDYEGLAAVGCEACHGPGGDHVAEDAAKRGTIVALRDKCDSCVILQICGGCHDDANDPGFEFEVLDKIERQRHGTIPLEGETAHHHDELPRSAELGLLEHAFAVSGQ